MPVQLPPQPPGQDVALPPHPNDPPTIDDIVLAQEYQRRVEFSGRGGPLPRPTRPDIARAEIYKTELVLAHRGEAMAPVWFEPALQNVLQNALHPIREELVGLRILAAQSRNAQLATGRVTPYEVVPFNDGTMPNEEPHNLPRLTDIDVIRILPRAQCVQYCQLYHLEGYGNRVAGMRRAIATKIGSLDYPH